MAKILVCPPGMEDKNGTCVLQKNVYPGQVNDDLDYFGSLKLWDKEKSMVNEKHPNYIAIFEPNNKHHFSYHKIVSVLIDNTLVTDTGLEIRIEEWRNKNDR